MNLTRVDVLSVVRFPDRRVVRVASRGLVLGFLLGGLVFLVGNVDVQSRVRVVGVA